MSPDIAWLYPRLNNKRIVLGHDLQHRLAPLQHAAHCLEPQVDHRPINRRRDRGAIEHIFGRPQAVRLVGELRHDLVELAGHFIETRRIPARDQELRFGNLLPRLAHGRREFQSPRRQFALRTLEPQRLRLWRQPLRQQPLFVHDLFIDEPDLLHDIADLRVMTFYFGVKLRNALPLDADLRRPHFRPRLEDFLLRRRRRRQRAVLGQRRRECHIRCPVPFRLQPRLARYRAPLGPPATGRVPTAAGSAPGSSADRPPSPPRRRAPSILG